MRRVFAGAIFDRIRRVLPRNAPLQEKYFIRSIYEH
jgi:hypothetical protein